MKKLKHVMPSLFLFVGKSKSGKSYLLKYLISYYCLTEKHFNFGLVLTGSDYNHEYKFLPSHAVHKYEEEVLNQYIDSLKEKKNNGEELPPSFLVLDDILGLISRSKAWQNLISTYRHLNITLFISVQYLRTEASSTLIREQTGALFAFKTTNINTMKCFFDYFGSNIFENLEGFKERFQKCTTEKHSCCLYLDHDKSMTKNTNFLMLKAPQFDLKPIKY